MKLRREDRKIAHENVTQDIAQDLRFLKPNSIII